MKIEVRLNCNDQFMTTIWVDEVVLNEETEDMGEYYSFEVINHNNPNKITNQAVMTCNPKQLEWVNHYHCIVNYKLR